MHRMVAVAGSLLLASIASAGAESLATGCLASATGQIYALHLYSNDPSGACREGDSIVRLAVHQPDTKFVKKRVTVPLGSHETLASFASKFPLTVDLRFDSAPLGTDEPVDQCELYLFYDEVVYMLASVAPSGEANGLTSIEVFHLDARKGSQPKPTTGAVRPLGPDDWAVQVHDLYVANHGAECYAAFLLEFADDPAKLYSR